MGWRQPLASSLFNVFHINRSAREAELPAIRKEEAECERLRDMIGERNKTQAILRHEATEDKAEIHRLKDELVSVITLVFIHFILFILLDGALVFWAIS